MCNKNDKIYLKYTLTTTLFTVKKFEIIKYKHYIYTTNCEKHNNLGFGVPTRKL